MKSVGPVAILADVINEAIKDSSKFVSPANDGKLSVNKELTIARSKDYLSGKNLMLKIDSVSFDELQPYKLT